MQSYTSCSPPLAKDGEPETSRSWVKGQLNADWLTENSPMSYRVHGSGITEARRQGREGRQSMSQEMALASAWHLRCSKRCKQNRGRPSRGCAMTRRYTAVAAIFAVSETCLRTGIPKIPSHWTFPSCGRNFRVQMRCNLKFLSWPNGHLQDCSSGWE